MKENEKGFFKKSEQEKKRVLSEAESFGELLRRIKIANRILLGTSKKPVLEEAELEDIRRASQKQTRESFLRYWGRRLSPEIALLPSEISQIVEKAASGQKLTSTERQNLKSYVKRRLMMLEFSAKKRLVMANLRKRLVDIDNGKDYEEHEKRKRRAIKYDPEIKMLFVEHRGKKIPITLDDILADGEWGILYYPDKSVPPIWRRRIRKRSDIAEARRQIESIFNEQLTKIQGIPLPTSAIPLENLNKIIEENPGSAAAGIIAERMVKTLLMRWARRNPGFSFKVESSNSWEDAELKYDFKIIFTKITKGIAVEGENMPRNEYVSGKKLIGVQLTTSANPKNLAKKSEQIERARKKMEEVINKSPYGKLIKRPVDDIVLLSLPFDGYLACFRRWEKEGKPPGGPEQFLDENHQREIYKAATAGIL